MGQAHDPRAVILEAFQSFGYTPTEEEIKQLVPVVDPTSGGVTRGQASVANYVQTVRAIQERQGNDPLNKVIADERGFFSETEARAAGYKDQLEGPVKLFGGLDEGQIDQYLQPLSRSAEQSGARLEGAALRRGISGSSTELQTLADNERTFRENVLSTGLQVGLDERNRITNLLMQQYGLLPGSLGRQAGIAGQQSSQYAEDQMYQSELPIYLRGIAAQEYAIEESIRAREKASRDAKRNRLRGTIGSIGGAIPGIVTANPMLAYAGSQIGSSLLTQGQGGGGPDLSPLLLLAANNPTARRPLLRSGTTPGTTYDSGVSYAA